MAEDAGAADLIAGGRLQLGISRGSPEQVIDGWRYFGYAPAEGETDADMARRHARGVPRRAQGRGLRQAQPAADVPQPARACCALEPHSEGLRERIWWGAASNATAVWAAQLGMNLQSSTLKFDESGEPLHVQQRKQIEAYRAAWKEAGHAREPRVVGQPQHLRAGRRPRPRATSAATRDDRDQIGYIDENTRAVFGRSYAAEPDVLVKELADGRGDRRRRHAAADGAEPARRGLQRARHREHPASTSRRSSAGADSPHRVDRPMLSEFLGWVAGSGVVQGVILVGRAGIPDHGPDPWRGGEGGDDDRQRLERDSQGRSARQRMAGPRRAAEGAADGQRVRGSRATGRPAWTVPGNG